MMQEWDIFRVVLAVAREGSLVGAGRVLGVSHATVGRQLKRAEDHIGAKLFDRMSNGLFPTSAGASAIEFAERIEAEVEAANIQLKGADSVMDGALRLSVPLNLVAYGLSEDLSAFQRVHPEVYLDLNATDEPVQFISRNVDVVIRAENNPSSGLWGYRLATVAYSFYGSREFMDVWQESIDADALSVRLPYIALNDTQAWRDRDQLLRSFPNAVAVAETNGLDSVLPMILDGIGVGRLGRFMGKRYDQLVPLLECEDACNRSLWILTHPDFRNTRRIRVFMDFLRDSFALRAKQFV